MMKPLGIGRALIERGGIRAVDGSLIETEKRIRRCAKRGTSRRKHIVEVKRDGYVHTYHATKGWRVNKS